MIEQYMLSLEGLARFQTASFVIFFAVFCVMVIWVSRLKRADLEALSRMPLDDSAQLSDSTHEVIP